MFRITRVASPVIKGATIKPSFLQLSMASVDPQDLVLRRTTSATSDYDTSSLSDTIRDIASSKLSSYDSTLTLVENEAKKPAEEDINKQSLCAAALEDLHRAASNRRAQARRGSRFWLSPTSFNISAWKDEFQSHPNAEQEAARWCADILAMRLPMCSARSSTYTELLVSHYSHLFACSQNWCTCSTFMSSMIITTTDLCLRSHRRCTSQRSGSFV